MARLSNYFDGNKKKKRKLRPPRNASAPSVGASDGKGPLKPAELLELVQEKGIEEPAAPRKFDLGSLSAEAFAEVGSSGVDPLAGDPLPDDPLANTVVPNIVAASGAPSVRAPHAAKAPVKAASQEQDEPKTSGKKGKKSKKKSTSRKKKATGPAQKESSNKPAKEEKPAPTGPTTVCGPALKNQNPPDVKPAMLVIMDGFGLEESGPGNAISLASKPYLDKLFDTCPNIQLAASGAAVGLPEGQMGNSEVGHLNIGAGRVVHQELSRINQAVADGSIEDNQVICEAIDKAVEAGRAVHLMGLLSDGGVHSHIDHCMALMELAAKRGARDIRVHAFLDGRDVDPTSGAGYLQQIVDFADKLFYDYKGCLAVIATVMGRYYAMDRDNRWDRVKFAYDAIAAGGGRGYKANMPVQAVKGFYESGETDEFVIPTVFDHRGMRYDDACIFFNFRPDRARELTRAFVEEDFDKFERTMEPKLHFVCLTEYDPTIPNVKVAFPKTFPENTLADYLATLGLRQFHIAETEKYAHVTFFFNGGVEEPKPGETRRLVPSPKVATYDLQPEMSAPVVTDELESAIKSDAADVYIVNYANCDMVGHTGVIDAARQAVEAVDAGLSRVVEAVLEKGGSVLVTADHGNADRMLAEDGVSPFTAHTTAPVPLILVSKEEGLGLEARPDACLADIAPTLIDIMGLDKPEEWTGNSLLTRK